MRNVIYWNLVSERAVIPDIPLFLHFTPKEEKKRCIISEAVNIAVIDY